jgi:hypothetical protein
MGPFKREEQRRGRKVGTSSGRLPHTGRVGGSCLPKRLWRNGQLGSNGYGSEWQPPRNRRTVRTTVCERCACVLAAGAEARCKAPTSVGMTAACFLRADGSEFPIPYTVFVGWCCHPQPWDDGAQLDHPRQLIGTAHMQERQSIARIFRSTNGDSGFEPPDRRHVSPDSTGCATWCRKVSAYLTRIRRSEADWQTGRNTRNP